MSRGKKYKEVVKTNTKEAMNLEPAIKQVKKNSISKFKGNQAKIDLHITLQGSDKKKEETQVLRVNLSLPHSLGGNTRVIAFAEGAEAEEAKKAGAIEAGSEDLVAKIEGGWMDFDVALATPAMMPKIAKLGRSLGTRGLMPNPKMGTVTTDIKATVEEFKKGKLAIKADTTGVIHVSVGTVEMDDNQVTENTEAAMKAIMDQTGKQIMNQAFRSAYLAPTMGPSVKLVI